jgi:hypothetical protein
MILVHLTYCATGHHRIAWKLIEKSLKLLQDEAFSPDQNARLLDCFAQHHICEYCISIPRLLALLLEADPSVINGTFGTDMLMDWLFFDSRQSSYSEDVVVKVLGMLIRADVDVNFTDFFGRTPSKHARERNTWDIWCRALKSCGKVIENVVSREGNSWLMGEDWKQVWRDGQYPGHRFLSSD